MRHRTMSLPPVAANARHGFRVPRSSHPDVGIWPREVFTETTPGVLRSFRNVSRRCVFKVPLGRAGVRNEPPWYVSPRCADLLS